MGDDKRQEALKALQDAAKAVDEAVDASRANYRDKAAKYDKDKAAAAERAARAATTAAKSFAATAPKPTKPCAPLDGDCGEKCADCLPKQDRPEWSHEMKQQLDEVDAWNTQSDRTNPKAPGFKPGGDLNTDYFDKTVPAFNELATRMKTNVLWIHGLAGSESGWMNVKNTLLNNPFGQQAKTTLKPKAKPTDKDTYYFENAGYDCPEQAAAHWYCLHGAKMSKTLEGKSNTRANFIQWVHDHYGSADKWYQNDKTFGGVVTTFEARAKAAGYVTQELGDGTVILVKAPAGKP